MSCLKAGVLELKGLMELLVRHAIVSFSCADVLRYFGKRVTKSGEVPDRFNRELKSNLKQYREGERVKFWLEGNSAKFHDKAYTESGNVRRAGETTNQNVPVFRAYRPKEGGPADDLQWRQMRQGIADLQRRAEVSQQVNNRLINALASVDDTRRLTELIVDIQQPPNGSNGVSGTYSPLARTAPSWLPTMVNSRSTVSATAICKRSCIPNRQSPRRNSVVAQRP